MKAFRKLVLTIVALAVTAWSVCAFTLIGPFAPWQTSQLGYDLRNLDIGGPMSLSEGYRWNIPIINYAFDSSFLDYFGSNGVVAVEKAIRILNDLPPMSQIEVNGNNLLVNGAEVPFETRGFNGDAEVLGLLDLKSTALTLLLEELGLAQPERYVYGLRARETETIGGVTFTNYLTVQRNFDPLSLRPTNSVNLIPYGYQIFEPIRPGDYASAVEIPPDLAVIGEFAYSSVRSGSGNPDLDVGQDLGNGQLLFAGLLTGQFFSGLTFDDLGGLRFLYGTNNLAVENLLPGVVGGVPAGGTSPWTPFLGFTNFVIGTNFFFSTNIFGTNNLRIQALRPGINKLRFQRVNYDSLVGETLIPVTNRYTDISISNGLPVLQPVERRITQPDILFLAGDLGVTIDPLPVLTRRTGTTGWQNNDAINGSLAQAGPGVITPQVQISFSDQLPFFIDIAPSFFGFFFGNIFWGSFDGSDNPPIVFPDYSGFTADDLRNIAVGQGGGE
jgi:hypothetical protein